VLCNAVRWVWQLEVWLLPFIKPSGVRGMYADRGIESYTDSINAALESVDIDYSERNVLLLQ
jgi:exonuclease SbcD